MLIFWVINIHSEELMSKKLQSRSKKGVINILTSLGLYSISIILSFFSREYFIKFLGLDILGLNSTIVNILGVLNVAELGVSLAIASSLYLPLQNQDFVKVNDILLLQKKLYRVVSFCFLILGILVIILIPIIFDKITISLSYPYATFVAMFIPLLLGYLVNYDQVLLLADQRSYLINLSVQGVRIIKVILQLICISNFKFGYAYWVVLELLLGVIAVVILKKIVFKSYYWYKLPADASLKNYVIKYPEIIIKTKQLFFHKIAYVTLTQTSPLILFLYTSLSKVAIYGNYMIIINGFTYLMQAFYSGLVAGIGNLIAEKEKDKVIRFFYELQALEFYLVGIICFIVYHFASAFVTLWVGPSYVLPDLTILLLTLFLFFTLTRIYDSFLAAYGMFQDVGAPLIEAVLNIGGSLLLGYFFGLNGILSGVIISLITVIFIWKPYFLFKYVFFISFLGYLKAVFLLASGIFLGCYIIPQILSFNSAFISWEGFLTTLILSLLLFSSFLFCFFYIVSLGFRDLVLRFKSYLCTR